MLQPDNGQFPQQQLGTDLTEYTQLFFMVWQILNRVQTATLVQVKAVTAGEGGLAGTVDVQPLVNQMTGARVAVEHGIIYGLPYMRMQGGSNAIVIDPHVGDIGIAIFASRDISAVKTTRAAANPGSFRMFDWADGIYLGGMLNGAPTQIIEFVSDGVTVTTPGTFTVNAAAIALNGPVQASSTIDAAGDVTGDGVSLATHLTTLVQPGGGTSGPPLT